MRIRSRAIAIASIALLAALLGAGVLEAQALCQAGGACNANNGLRWIAPTTNTDLSALTDFAGFEVVFGAAPGVCAAPTGTTTRDVGALAVPAAPPVNTPASVVLGTLGLPQGPVVAAIKARDTGGNRSACSTEIAFTFDSVAPNTTITANPPTIATSATGTFTFTSSEPGGTFECKLDAAAFAACASPQTYTALVDGNHTFQVRAIDLAGNVDTTPALYPWSVNTTTPSAPTSPTVN